MSRLYDYLVITWRSYDLQVVSTPLVTLLAKPESNRMRPFFVPLVLSYCSLFGLCSCDTGVSPTICEADVTTNVLWLVCEDQSLFMPPYGDSTATMPNVCSLADDGVVYDYFFAVSPVCAPSRSSILTGIQPVLMGSHHMRAFQANQPEKNSHTSLPIYSAPAPAGVKAFTELLRAEGVYCTNNSKEDYNFRTPPLAWDESSVDAHWRNRPNNVSFFSVFNFNVSHESQIWKSDGLPCLSSNDEFEVPLLLPDHERVRTDLATNYCNLEKLDYEVGLILDQLKYDGLYDKTTIVFFSDHGGPFPRYKRALSDAGLRVPFIIKWANETGLHERDESIYSFLDLAPSVLHWMGVELPDILPGKPITKGGNGHDEVHGACDRLDEQTDRSRTIRTRNWRLIRNDFYQFPAGPDLKYRDQMQTSQVIDSLADAGIAPWSTWKNEERAPWELYHTAVDPLELNNVVGKEEYQEVFLDLKSRLEIAFPPEHDLGMMVEGELIARFSTFVDTHPMAEATLEKVDGQIYVRHIDSDVSLGWRVLGEEDWRVVKNGNAVSVPTGAERIELLATKIGWPFKACVADIPH